MSTITKLISDGARISTQVWLTVSRIHTFNPALNSPANPPPGINWDKGRVSLMSKADLASVAAISPKRPGTLLLIWVDESPLSLRLGLLFKMFAIEKVCCQGGRRQLQFRL